MLDTQTVWFYWDYLIQTCFIWIVDQRILSVDLTDLMLSLFAYSNEILNQSEGLQNIGGIQWQLALYLLLCWFIVFMCLVRGIYSAGKVRFKHRPLTIDMIFFHFFQIHHGILSFSCFFCQLTFFHSSYGIIVNEWAFSN